MDVREHNLKQIEHIKIHKWYMSEAFGFDVGDDQAALDWCKNYALLFREGKLDITENYLK